ncbi:MAG: helicase-related protein [Syntrophomonas sp.]|nr:helicase-related protein [Syntrophomonas sp.]
MGSKGILLIADECHHYSSPENSHIFDFMAQIPVGVPSLRYYSLGLSATPETPAFNEKMVPALGPEIFKYGFVDALNANIISSFSIFNLKLKFSQYEEEQYLELSDQLIHALEKLMQCCPFLIGLSSQRFFATLEQLAQVAEDSNVSGLARLVLVLAIKRKDVVYRAESRISCVKNLLTRIPQTSKVLIFNERIEVAEALYEQLQLLFPGQVGRYHSEMDEGSRKNILRKYQDSEIRILVSCRALDEGLNVPETDVGIIASSTSSSRQRIQRLGRILRRSWQEHTACLYYLYIGSSNEEQDLLTDMTQELMGVIPVLDLDYEQESQSFLHPAYQVLVDRVLAYARRKSWSPKIIGEIERNMERGKLGCDWWVSEKTCRLRIKSAPSRSERNYWISMRLLVQASLNRLPL